MGLGLELRVGVGVGVGVGLEVELGLGVGVGVDHGLVVRTVAPLLMKLEVKVLGHEPRDLYG